MSAQQIPLTLEKIRALREIKPHELTPGHFTVQPPLPVIALGDADSILYHIDIFQTDGSYPGYVHFTSGYWHDPHHYRHATEHEQ